jgi:capsular polysaccharide biosynthesis protein
LTRRRATIVVPALCATMLGALVSLALPRVYVAETQIEIAGANGLGGADYQSRVAAVADQILCRDAFDKVATKLRLDVDFASLPEGERKEKREALLARLKDDAGCSVKAAGEAQTVATITSSGADADLATRVVGALAEQAMSLAGNPTIAVKEKTEAEREAVTKTAKQALDAADLARQDFRAQNREFLEGAAHKLQATRDQKKQLKESTIAGLEQKRKDLDEMLLQERPFETVTVRQADPLKLAAIEEKIATSKEHVRQLTTVDKRADTDPDVAAERKAIAEAEDEKKKLIAEAPQTEQRRENEQWAQLTRAKGETQSRLDAANRQLKLLVETEKEQEELARRTPEFEANAAKLDAAYETAKEAHDKVAAELAKAQTDLSAERARGELAIHTILAAEKPHSPAGPGALVLAGMGLALGAIAGFVAACVLDATDHSFRDEASVTQFLGVPTLGAVRVIETPAEAAQRRARRRKSSAVLAVLGVAALAVVAVALFGDAHGVADFVKSVVG